MIKEVLLQLQARLMIPFRGLTVAQRATILFIMFLTVVGGIVVLNWALKPEYSVLVSDIEPADMQAVSEELKSQSISFRLENDGRHLMVPRSKIYDARLALAKQDLLYENSVGYELFDKKDIGISEFVQQINYRRALEGEISRTIQSMQEVEKARVHVVFPKDRLYKKDQKEPTASIVLTMKRRTNLSESQIVGITHLVARSIEGLSPENISILDDHGNLLSDFKTPNSVAGLSDTQLDIQTKVESYLEDKAESMLVPVVGRDNVVVRIRADLDFRQIERTNENYDPDNPIVLSEESDTQTTTGGNAGDGNAVEHTVVNYQLTKSIEHIVGDVGSIDRLSVAVLVNNKFVKVQNETSETALEPQARTPLEIQQITSLVQSAIGYDANRGDQIQVQNVAFEGAPPQYIAKEPFGNEWFPYLKRLVYVLLIGIALLVLRSRFKKAQQQFSDITAAKAEEEQSIADIQAQLEREYQEKLETETKTSSLEDMERERVQKSITEFVEQNPGSAAKLVKAWMMED